MRQSLFLLIAVLSRAYGRGPVHETKDSSVRRKEVENAVSTLSSLVSGRRGSGLLGKGPSFSLLASKSSKDEKESSEEDDDNESGEDDEDNEEDSREDDDNESEEDEDDEDIGDIIAAGAEEKIENAANQASEMGQGALEAAKSLPQVQAAQALTKAVSNPLKLFG